METNLPTPMTARVYVKLLEGIMIDGNMISKLWELEMGYDIIQYHPGILFSDTSKHGPKKAGIGFKHDQPFVGLMVGR